MADEASGSAAISADDVIKLFPELCKKGAPAKPNDCLNLSKRGLGEIASLPVIGTVEAPLRRLDVSENSLTRLRGLDSLKGLTMLDASSNKLGGQALVDIAPLTGLKVLNVGSNRIKDIPASALRGQSSSLLALVANENKISDITPLCGLTNVNSVILSHNRIAAIPPAVAKLSNLCKLGLAHNSSLASLPSELSSLKKLAELRLNDCAFDSVPEVVGRVQSLRMLDLGNNKVADLKTLAPLADLPKLTQLNLRGNPAVPAYDKEQEGGGSEYRRYVAAVRALCPRLALLDNRKLDRLPAPGAKAAAPGPDKSSAKAHKAEGAKQKARPAADDEGRRKGGKEEDSALSGKRKRPVEEEEDDDDEDERMADAGKNSKHGHASKAAKASNTGAAAKAGDEPKKDKKNKKDKKAEEPKAKKAKRKEKEEVDNDEEEEEEPAEAVVVKMNAHAAKTKAMASSFVDALASATDAANVVAGGWD